MIATLLQAIQPTLLSHNSKPKATMPVPAISSSFVRAGASPKRSNRVCLNRSLLGSVSDWKMLDFRHKPYLFPPHMFSTTERHDILIYSNSLRVVIFEKCGKSSLRPGIHHSPRELCSWRLGVVGIS